MQIVRKPFPSAAEPVDLALAKAHLRITHSHEDTLLERYISSAREACEAFARMSILKKTITIIYRPFTDSVDDFALLGQRTDIDNISNGVRLPWGPILSVNSIRLTDHEDVGTDLEATRDFSYDADFGTLGWVDLARFSSRETKGIRVTYLAGYEGPDDVPGPVIEAILEATATAYTTRGDLVAAFPVRCAQLLGPFANPINMAG